MLRLAFEASPAAMFMVDQDGRIEMANAQCEEIFGYAAGELIGVTIDRLVPAALRSKHKELRRSFNANPSKRQMGVGRDLRALRRDGGVFPVEIGLTPVETPLGPRVVAFAIDISARLDTEETLKNSLAELERANESLSRFAYVASHDIQEPLRKISAFADVLVAAMAQGSADEARYAADVMATSARHARHLVADLLILARSFNDACALETVTMRETIQLVLDSLSQTIAEEAAEIEILGEDFSIRGDKAQPFQLVQNLVSNAVKYHKQGQAPHVRLLLRKGEAEQSLAIEDAGDRLRRRPSRGDLRALSPSAQSQRNSRHRHRSRHLQDHRQTPWLAADRPLDPDRRLNLRDRLSRWRRRREWWRHLFVTTNYFITLPVTRAS